MKKIIFTEDWQGYKKDDELTTRESVAHDIVELHKVAKYNVEKKGKK